MADIAAMGLAGRRRSTEPGMRVAASLAVTGAPGTCSLVIDA